MARKQDEVRPTDEVRYTGIMTREDRARFKYFCELRGLEMERVGPQWILERLDEEDRHAARKPPPRGK